MKEFDRKDYAYGWSSDLEEDRLPPGLNEDTIRAISRHKQEPNWLLDWRLAAYEGWQKKQEPKWSTMQMPQQNLQAISYFSKPKKKTREDIDPAVYEEFERLGIPLKERDWLAGVAVDAVLDSESVVTTHKEKLKEVGVIFCAISEAVRDHPELVKTFLGSVVPAADNYWAGLNSAVFSDGSFVYIPPGVTCPMELSTYFRINAQGTGQFERTLIIADKGSRVSYLEGCTAPKRDENQLHAAVVELVALEDAEIKYSTVQNWYPGDAEGRGGILNYVTKRGRCAGARSRIIWTQVETGSAVTWNEQGNTSVGPTVFAADSIEIKPVKLLLEHDRTRPIGKMVSHNVTANGIEATFKIANTMAGAGAVVGLMKTLALRKSKSYVIGTVALVENMPGGSAQRPGDIVKSYIDILDNSSYNNQDTLNVIEFSNYLITSNKLQLPIASSSVLGGVKQGTNISIDSSGVISINLTNYNGNAVIDGNLTTSNLTVLGSSTILDTNVYITERLEIINDGLNNALNIKQNAQGSYDIINISNYTNEVFKISNNGAITFNDSINNINKDQFSKIANITINDTNVSNYVNSTSNFLKL